MSSKPARKPGRLRRLMKKRWIALIVILIAVLWQNMHLTSVPVPPPSNRVFNYPDSFALRTEHLNDIETKQYVVQTDDNLGQILQKFNIPLTNLDGGEHSCPGFQEIGLLQPDETFSFQYNNQEQEPFRFVCSRADGQTYTFVRTGTQWNYQKREGRFITVTQTIRGSIAENLYDSAVQAGLPPKLILDLADLFACDIDFNTDLQKGDTFSVYFEHQVAEGKKVRPGPIVAAEMLVGGVTCQTFRYQLPDGSQDYFRADGTSMHKLFLRAPLSYSRISSTFTNSRYHPILRINRPHFGIDYAAPTGTPVSSLGDGTVTFIGNNRGFGRYIEVRHNELYRTTYGHLSRFASGLKAGSKVEQGQVIGYVGATGIATGPHLDFRFYKSGKPVDFLKANFPHSRSVPKSLQADFDSRIRFYLTTLQHGGQTAGIADAGTSSSENN